MYAAQPAGKLCECGGGGGGFAYWNMTGVGIGDAILGICGTVMTGGGMPGGGMAVGRLPGGADMCGGANMPGGPCAMPCMPGWNMPGMGWTPGGGTTPDETGMLGAGIRIGMPGGGIKPDTGGAMKGTGGMRGPLPAPAPSGAAPPS